MAPENPLQLGHEIAFFSELIEPEQATFQTVIDNYTKANVFLSCTSVITIFIIFFMDHLFAYFIRNVGITNIEPDECVPLIIKYNSICNTFARQRVGVYLGVSMEDDIRKSHCK